MLRSTYHVFDLYVNYMGDVVLDAWSEEMPKLFVKHKNGADLTVDALVGSGGDCRCGCK